MKNTILSAALLSILFLASCVKGVDEVAKQEENDKLIREYLSTHNLVPSKDSLGMVTVVRTPQPSARKLNLGDSIEINIELFTLDGTRIQGSETGKPWGMLHGYAPFVGIDLALSWMRIGEKATVLIPYYLAYGPGGSSDGKVPGYTPVRVELELVNAKSEIEQITSYFSKKQLTPDLVNDEGLYMAWITKVADGDSVGTNKMTTVNYKGFLLNGAEFDNGTLNHQTGSTGLIRGFDLGVRRLKAGEKALVIFPSKLGYKHQGQGQKIPPFAPLAFEIELTKIN